ncbi:hypothetical protein ABZS96_42035 [Streptomyces avermitilis]|uniref:hypothetical protein n=1 Tax=Streptomyces avermitilis TaxID=33903 RepID=UPI0033A7BA2C
MSSQQAESFGLLFQRTRSRDRARQHSAYVGADQNVIAGGREREAYDALLGRLEKASKRKEYTAVAAMGADRTAWSTEQAASSSAR